MTAIQTAYQQPPLLMGSEGAEVLSVPSGLPIVGGATTIGKQGSRGQAGHAALQQDSLQTHTLQGSTDKPSRHAVEGDGRASGGAFAQGKNRLQVDPDESAGKEESIVAELARHKRSPARKEAATTEEQDGHIGPGQYEPKIEAARKQAPAYSWGISKTVRDDAAGPSANK